MFDSEEEDNYTNDYLSLSFHSINTLINFNSINPSNSNSWDKDSQIFQSNEILFTKDFHFSKNDCDAYENAPPLLKEFSNKINDSKNGINSNENAINEEQYRISREENISSTGDKTISKGPTRLKNKDDKDEKDFDKNSSEKANNAGPKTSSKNPIFKVITRKPPKTHIDYKREGVKKKLKSRILKKALKLLNRLICKYSRYLKQYNKRKNKIKSQDNNLITKKVTAEDDKKIWKMSFRKILTEGKSSEKKNKAYQNNCNINYILDSKSINNHNKNDNAQKILKKIKRLLYMRFKGLIKIFVKSRDFKKFKDDDNVKFCRNCLKKEKDGIDIFTKKGIIRLFRPLNLKRFGLLRKFDF